MFCRHCGESNNDHSIYCSKDGVLLYESNNSIQLSRNDSKFCKSCGHATESYDLYCANCGLSLYEGEKNNSIIKIPNIKGNKVLKDNVDLKTDINIKSSLTYSGFGVGIIFLISIIISLGINSFLKEQFSYGFNMPVDIKLFNPLDLVLLFNSTNLNLTTSMSPYNYATTTLSGVPLVLLLIPFIVFFVMGIHMAKANNRLNNTINFKDILFTGISYGLILSIIALVNRASINLGGAIFGESLVLRKNFVFFTALINGVLISTISLLLGYMIYWKSSKNDNLIGDYKYLFDGLFMFFSGIILIGIGARIFITIALEGNTSSKLGDFAMMSQLGVYAFLMVNFGILVIGEDFLEVKVSLLKNVDFIKETFDTRTVVFLFMMVLVPIILFFIYGKRAKERNNKKFIYTTLIYSLIVGVVAYISHIKLLGTGEVSMLGDIFDANVNMGFKILYSIIGSFILSTLSTLTGYLLAREERKVLSN